MKWQQKDIKMYILGISSYYHDSAAALILDGIVMAAAQEERFTRVKNDSSFPLHAIEYCLSEMQITLSDISIIVYYEKPYLKFERILDSFYRSAPYSFNLFREVIPHWIKGKLYFKKMMRNELSRIPGYSSKIPILFSSHHLSHAASAFFVSSFKEAAILTVDGVGEWTTLSISVGVDNTIKTLKEMRYPHSVGLLYSSFTYFLGFEVNLGEYKLMGLASYGNRKSELVKKYILLIKNEMVRIYNDGSIFLNMKYFAFEKEKCMIDEGMWCKLFGVGRRVPEERFLEEHIALGCACQVVLEEIMLLLVSECKKITGLDNICLAGGVALNCVSNARIIESKIFNSVFIQPAAGDAGGAIGAALCGYYMHIGASRVIKSPDLMQGAYLGPKYADDFVSDFLVRNLVKFHKCVSDEELVSLVANFLSKGLSVGWFQGRMEFGPRALGNRSILADPRPVDMQERLNRKIKFRESFRPFAPIILEDLTDKYFPTVSKSRYMLQVAEISDEYKIEVPDNYFELSIEERLKVKRSNFQSITHVDFSSRVQTVSKDSNPLLYSLLKKFYSLTSCPMLINTSFNIRGEPIVCNPKDAYSCFVKTNLDILVIGHYIIRK